VEQYAIDAREAGLAFLDEGIRVDNDILLLRGRRRKETLNDTDFDVQTYPDVLVRLGNDTSVPVDDALRR
jgi:hypothetical protein